MSLRNKIREKVSRFVGKALVQGNPMTTLLFTDPDIMLLPDDTFTITGEGVMVLRDKDGKQTGQSKFTSGNSIYTNDDGVVTALQRILATLADKGYETKVQTLTMQIQYGKTESLDVVFVGGHTASVVLPLTVG